jgi:hypothetical protein
LATANDVTRADANRRLVALELAAGVKPIQVNATRAKESAAKVIDYAMALRALTIGLTAKPAAEGTRRVQRSAPGSAKGKKMTQTPGGNEPPKQISRAEREARKAFREVDAKTAMSEHEIAQAAFSKNRERLKTERLAREAAATPPTKAKHKAKKK